MHIESKPVIGTHSVTSWLSDNNNRLVVILRNTTPCSDLAVIYLVGARQLLKCFVIKISISIVFTVILLNLKSIYFTNGMK